MTTKNLAERIGVVETKVENLSEKLDELKADVVGSKEEIKRSEEHTSELQSH